MYLQGVAVRWLAVLCQRPPQRSEFESNARFVGVPLPARLGEPAHQRRGYGRYCIFSVRDSAGTGQACAPVSDSMLAVSERSDAWPVSRGGCAVPCATKFFFVSHLDQVCVVFFRAGPLAMGQVCAFRKSRTVQRDVWGRGSPGPLPEHRIALVQQHLVGLHRWPSSGRCCCAS